MVEKKLGTLGKDFGRKKEKGMDVFQGYTKNNICNSRERKRFSHARCHIADCNGQIVDVYPVNLQTKFLDDPTVNKCRRAFLPRQLQVASLRGFLEKLPHKASLRSFLV